MSDPTDTQPAGTPAADSATRRCITCSGPIVDRSGSGRWSHLADGYDDFAGPHPATPEPATPPDEPAGRRLMDIGEFRRLGYLQELNRQFLHPLGLAMAISVDSDGAERLSGVWDDRDDPEGIRYAPGVLDPEKTARVLHAQRRMGDSRLAVLGYVMQPVGGADTPEPARDRCQKPACLPSVNVEESTEGPGEWPVCGRELPCPVHAQPHGERRAATGPPPGTLGGPGVLGRALLDEHGGLWPLVGEEDAHRCGAVAPSARHRFEADRGQCREVLLVDPAAGRVLEAMPGWYAEFRKRPVRLGEVELATAWDDLAAAVDALDRPTTGGPDADLGGVSTAEAEAGAERLTANLAAASRGLAAAEPAPEPDAGPVRPVDLAAVRHAAGGGFGSKGVDPEPAPEPAGDGPGWTRSDIEAFLANLGAAPHDGVWNPEMAAEIRALLADRDHQHDRRFALNQMLAEAWEQRDAARADLARLRELTADSIDPATIPDQRAKNWADWHPEAYCHRCGRPNVSWYADSAIWNEVHGGSGPIWCMACFAVEYDDIAGERISWRLAPADRSDELGALIQSEAAMRHELAEVIAERDRLHGVAERAMSERRDATAERVRLRRHSTTLNTIGWKLAEALGDVPEGADRVEGNPLEQAERLIQALATARRDAAADAWDDAAGRIRRIWTDSVDPERCAKYLEAMARGTRAGTRPVPGSPQPAPDGGEEQA